MRKFALVALCIVVASFVAPARASASMIGDLITVTRYYPDLSTIYTAPPDAIPGFVVVTPVVGLDPGASPQPVQYSIDIEATSIYFDFGSPSAFGGTAAIFDGLRFSGISPLISGVGVGSVGGISVVGLAFGQIAGLSYIDVNLAGVYASDAHLRLDVRFVPEPTLLALLGLGLVVTARRRRRTRTS